jgi:predicted alpha/beta hydrolase
MTSTRFNLAATDGATLVAHCFEPSAPPRAGVVIASAMAVPQSFYSAFAQWLSQQGYRVWTFDYRGIGLSGNGSMRSCRADITTWITRDHEALVQHASNNLGGLPLFVLGHSLGGQTAPLLPSHGKLSGLVNIAVGSGAVRHNQPPVRRRAPLLWYMLAPLLCPVFGYFPGGRIGMLGDIPRHVLFQWRRWCLSPDYLLSGEHGARTAYAAARYPVLGLTFSDDELLLESGSRMLHEAYTGAQVDYRELGPQQFSLPRIGHFGFFKSHMQASLWPLVSDWLAQRCSALAGSA